MKELKKGHYEFNLIVLVKPKRNTKDSQFQK
jgi:hypothetical protein